MSNKLQANHPPEQGATITAPAYAFEVSGIAKGPAFCNPFRFIVVAANDVQANEMTDTVLTSIEPAYAKAGVSIRVMWCIKLNPVLGIHESCIRDARSK